MLWGGLLMVKEKIEKNSNKKTCPPDNYENEIKTTKKPAKIITKSNWKK